MDDVFVFSPTSFEQLFEPCGPSSLTTTSSHPPHHNHHHHHTHQQHHPFDMDPNPFDVDRARPSPSFLSFSSFGEFAFPGAHEAEVERVDRPFWMEDETTAMMMMMHNGNGNGNGDGHPRQSMSDLNLAFDLPSPPHSASSSSEQTSNTPYYFHPSRHTDPNPSHPSPPLSNLPLPPSVLAFPYDAFQDRFNLKPYGGSAPPISSHPAAYDPYGPDADADRDPHTPLRALNNKDSMESFASSTATAPSELILTPQLRPHTSAGELDYVTPVMVGQSRDPTYPFLTPHPVHAKRQDESGARPSLPVQVYGQSPSHGHEPALAPPLTTTGSHQQHGVRRRGSAIPLMRTLENVAEEGPVHGGARELIPAVGRQSSAGDSGAYAFGSCPSSSSSSSSSYLMPSAEIVGNIPNWQATVPTYSSQHEFEGAMNARAFHLGAPIDGDPNSDGVVDPASFLAHHQQRQRATPTYGRTGDEEQVDASRPHQSLLAVPNSGKSVSMRKTKSMDHVRRASGGKPKALFAFHPTPLPSSRIYPAAFSTMPLATGVRTDVAHSSSSNNKQYHEDVFSGQSVMIPAPATPSAFYDPSAAPAPMMPRAIPSVLAQPAVDPSLEVWPPLPPRAQQVPTIAPLNLNMPLDFLHNPAPSMLPQEYPAAVEYVPERMAMETASVLQPVGSLLPLGLPLDTLEPWTPRKLSQAVDAPLTHSRVPDRHRAPPVLTCVPLARPSTPAPTKLISPLPKAPRLRTPSKAGPKSRKAAPSQAGFGFINFTAVDADKLLTGVAPSGSQKRKRDGSAEAFSAEDDSAGLNVVIGSGSAKRARV